MSVAESDKPILNVVWFSSDGKGLWNPLWRHDNETLELHYEANNINACIPVFCTRFSVHIDSRFMISNYDDGIPTCEVRRGTWFYKHQSNKYFPINETTATEIEMWYQSIMVFSSPSILTISMALILYESYIP